MPEPRENENRDDFLNRCMSDTEAVNDFPNEDQRFAFCVSQWENKSNMRNIEELKKKKLDMFYPVKSSGLDMQVKNVDLAKRTVQFIANTYYWFDSDYDVLIKGASKKSINDRGPASNANAKIKHLADHKMQTDKMVGLPKIIEETVIDDKTVIYFESEIPETQQGDEHLTKYQNGMYDNHSIGFRYKDIEFAEKDSENSDAKEYWNEYFPQIINREEAEKAGFFYLIKEIELFEASVVPFGANSLTGVVGVKSKTKEQILFDLYSRMSSIESQLKKGDFNKDSEKSIELQILQIKQLMNDIIFQKPSEKDTLKEPPTNDTKEIDYKFLANELEIKI